MVKITVNNKDKNDVNLKRILQKGTLLDIGGGTPWKTGWIHKNYHEILEKNGFCLDYTVKKRPHIVGDIQNLPIKDNSVDGIICNAVLEHVPDPHSAVKELYRILKPGGEAFVYVPFLYGYHSEPDYFRFTEKAIYALFKDFNELTIQPGFEGRGGVVVSLMVFNHELLSKILRVIMGKPLNLIYKMIIYTFYRFVKNEKNLEQKIFDRLYLKVTHGYHITVTKGE